MLRGFFVTIISLLSSVLSETSASLKNPSNSFLLHFPELSLSLQQAYQQCKKEFSSRRYIKAPTTEEIKRFYESCYKKQNIDLDKELEELRERLLTGTL
jgi:hypothetical protein